MAEDNGKRRPPTRAEKFKNYCIGLGALSALLLGIWANVKGEPIAEKTWATLRIQVNALIESVNKLHVRVVSLQAHEEGRTAAEIQLKLDGLQRRYDALVAKQGTQTATSAPVPAPAAPRECRKGLVRGSDGRCRYVHRTVAAKVQEDKKRAAAARKALEAEKRRRLEAERRRRELMKRLQQAAKPAPKPMPKLPVKLDEAAQ